MRTMTRMYRAILLVLPLLLATAFQPLLFRSRASTGLFDATGGWGVGNSREMSDLEKSGRKRRSFEKYEAQGQGEFLRQVQQDRRAMRENTKKELMSVAEFAGIDFKDPTQDKFAVDLFMDDEDDLDVSVQFEEDEDGEIYMVDSDSSITRLDEDTGAPGVW